MLARGQDHDPFRTWEDAMHVHSLLRAVVIAASLIAIPTAIAAELVPYAPPASRASVPAQKQAVVVPESFYTDFAAQVSQLNRQQRKELTATFEHSRYDAEQSGDLSQAIHYKRLLEILGRT
jgi:hypothetical protein